MLFCLLASALVGSAMLNGLSHIAKKYNQCAMKDTYQEHARFVIFVINLVFFIEYGYQIL